MNPLSWFSNVLGVGSVWGMGTLGQSLIGEVGSEVTGDLLTQMALSPFMHQASQAEMIAGAEAGIGQAYARGATILQSADFKINEEMAKVFSSAGGH